MINVGSLYKRIALVFAAALLATAAFFGWLSFHSAKRNQREVLQRLNLQLAQHIVGSESLADANGLKSASVEGLFHMLMVVNPNIEVYLLDTQGHVVGYSPTDDPVVRKDVSLIPIQRLLNGAALPVLGDNPRNAERQDVFSAAPVTYQGQRVGYVYIVLLNRTYQRLIEGMQRRYVLHSTLGAGAVVVLLSLLAGFAAFALITRRLDRLTREVIEFEQRHLADEAIPATRTSVRDEIDRVAQSFARLTQRLARQMKELQRQDTLRRELVANVAHDLRTPLTSMQSYLETLQRLGAELSATQRHEYLGVAVRQSRQVAHLAQQLFELAQLELEETPPQVERFTIAELIHDIAQKFALAAASVDVSLQVDVDHGGAFVRGDIGLIERVISNLVDNALRYTPRGGRIILRAQRCDSGIEVRVIDTGSGIDPGHLPSLFHRDSPLRNGAQRRCGGLGLLIAHRILALHNIGIEVDSALGVGSCFRFVMQLA
jgi:signal transduction histidine kinase